MTSRRILVAVSTLGLVVAACSGEDGQTQAGTGGTPATGGLSASGGAATGGIATTGGTPSTGGVSGSPGTGGAATGGVGTGGASTGGVGTGGVATGGVSTGGVGTGGTPTGGVATGGVGTGGVATGGETTGGQATGGEATGGQATGGEATGGQGGAATGGQGGEATGGSETGGSSGEGEPGNYPIGNAPVPTAACGTPTTLTTGERTINSSNQNRVYYLDLPANYDPNKPYRFFYISHWIGSRYQDMVNNHFYGLKTIADSTGEPAIFVAPSSDGQTWQEKDHALFDDILAFMKENLCFDTSRVFTTGFSFGGMITYSLSTNHQKDIRAAVGIAPANYNIWLPQKTHEPIAWMQTTGMGDGTCPWDQNGSTNGAKYIALEKGEDNNCTIPSSIPTWQNGDHVCYDFEGCDVNHPVKACTFDGGHQAESRDSTSSNWIPEVSWEFFTQF